MALCNGITHKQGEMRDETVFDFDEDDFEPNEPELEPDIDDFGLESVPTTARQVSVMSNFTAKVPSRQVTTMSDWGADYEPLREWEPNRATTRKRIQTEEFWPTWCCTDPQSKSGQYCATPFPSQSSMSSNMVPYPSKKSVESIILTAAIQSYEPFRAFQLAH